MKRTLRHPIRGDRLHPKPSTRSPRRSAWRRSETRQPRLRPRKGVNVGALVGSPEEEESRPNLRLYIVGLIVLVLFGVLVLRLWTLQVVEGKTFAAAVTRNQVRVVSIPPPRGEIVDRDGTVLVSNQPEEEILLSQSEAKQNPAIIGMVAALVGETPAQVQAAVNNKQYSPYEPVPVAKGVSDATVQFIQTHQSEYPGVSAETVSQRSYPQGGTTATHVLGYSGAITSSFLAAHPNQGYTQGSQIGVSGIEAQYEPYLRGIPGRQALSVDAGGDVVGTLSTTAPKIGDTVVLNVDTGLQEFAQNVLQQQILSDRQTVDSVSGQIPPAPNGAVVVLNPQNGQVLALASYPTYDLNEWVGGISNANFEALQASTAENDNAIDGLYTPGSTFKLVTATAALQTGLWSPGQSYDDTGSFKIPGCPGAGATNDTGCVLNDDPGDSGGIYDISGALTVSSDSFFYNLGDLFWNDRGTYGDYPIQSQATAYGEGTITGIDLPGEAQGRVDSYLQRAKLHAEAPKGFPNTATWYTADNIEMAFGQGETVLTPIEQAVDLRHVRQRRHPVRAPGRLRSRRPRHGPGDQEVRAQGDGARDHRPGQLRRHPLGARGRHHQGHRRPGLRRLPRLVEPGRKDGHGVERVGAERAEAGAQQLVRGVRAQSQPAVPRAGGDRPGWLRRPGRRAARAQHLRLPRGQPDQPDREHAHAGPPAQPGRPEDEPAPRHADDDHADDHARRGHADDHRHDRRRAGPLTP